MSEYRHEYLRRPEMTSRSFEVAVLPIGSTEPHRYLAFTCPWNATGHPALSVPMGLVDGLPVGLQLVGHRDDDARLLRLAAAFESVLPSPSASPSGR